jgi:SAM-dependent methyltransferase
MSEPSFSSTSYWIDRYRRGETSGSGSAGRLARYKAAVINAFVRDNGIDRVFELGCGDGQQAGLYDFPDFTGVDVSPDVVAACSERFASRPGFRFLTLDRLDEVEPAPLALSLDVIFHLTEDDVFQRYMLQLFAYATRYVIVYSSNVDLAWQHRHVRHRRFSEFVRQTMPEWHLVAQLPNPYPWDERNQNETSFADFFIYRRGKDPVRLYAAGPET